MLRIRTGKKSSISFRFHAYTVIKNRKRADRSGKANWFYAVFYWCGHGSWYPYYREFYCDRNGSHMSAVRISYVLQISGKCAPGILPACDLSVLKIKKQPPHSTGAYDITYALSTFPDLKQEVHTYIFFAPPAVVFTLTDLTLDFHILLDLLWE